MWCKDMWHTPKVGYMGKQLQEVPIILHDTVTDLVTDLMHDLVELLIVGRAIAVEGEDVVDFGTEDGIETGYSDDHQSGLW